MSTDNKLTVQQAAKNGNPQAIAILLNRQLQPKGITAKVSVKDSCLQIMLEAANVPNQKALVMAIQKWLDGLGITSIQSVQVYAKQTGEEIPAWNDRFEIAKPLEEPKTANVASVALQTPQTKPIGKETANQVDSALVELAKNGDTKAISELIKNSLQQADMKVRATLSKGLLQVVIVSNKVPKQDKSVEAIPKLVTSFKSTLIQKVKVVGMQEIEGSNNSNIFWVQESVIELPVNNHEQEEVNQKLQDALRYAEKVQKEYYAVFDPKISQQLIDEQITLYEQIYNSGLARVISNSIASYISSSGEDDSNAREMIFQKCESLITQNEFSAASYTVAANILSEFDTGYRVFMRQGKIIAVEKSIEYCNKALSIDPQFIKAREIRLKYLEGTIIPFNHALDFTDDEIDMDKIKVSLSNFLKSDGVSLYMYTDVIQDFNFVFSVPNQRRQFSVNYYNGVDYYYLRGIFFYILGNYEGSVSDFSFLIQYEGENPHFSLFLIRAKCFYELNEYEKTIEDCNQIISRRQIKTKHPQYITHYCSKAYKLRAKSKEEFGDKTGASNDLNLAGQIIVNQNMKEDLYAFLIVLGIISLLVFFITGGFSRLSSSGKGNSKNVCSKSGDSILDASCWLMMQEKDRGNNR